MKILYLGAGYCSEFVTPLIKDKAEIIAVHSKRPFNIKFKEFKNIQRLTFEDFLSLKEKILKNTTHILISIPPDNQGDLAFKHIKRILENKNSIKWLGYFSTTGVYGDHRGGWVNESSQLRTENKRSLNRILAENQYLELYKNYNLPIHIFRLPGIYGPNRSVLGRIKKNEMKLIKTKRHFFSRVYVTDIAEAIYASINNITPGEIYNVTDDYPCSAIEVASYAYKILGIPIPPKINLEDKDVNDMTRSFYKENKKVSNQKIKQRLKWYPRIKDYKQGLNEILNKRL